MASFAFDRTAAKIRSKALAFDIHYDADEQGEKTNPRIDLPKFSLGGLQWNLVVRPLPDDEEFAYGLSMELSEECQRALAAGYEIGILFTATSSDSEGNLGERRTGNVVLPCDGQLLKFNSMVVHYEMTIDMLKLTDVRPYRLQFLDEAVAKTKKSDCEIVLEDDEDKVVFVNRIILAYNSPFFDQKFFGEFKDENQKAVKLNNVTETEFLEYLYCVYPPPNRPLAFKRLEVLLRLADRFQNDELLGIIETFLRDKLEKKNISSEEKSQALEWTDAYRMPTLFAEIVESLDKKELGSLDEEKCDKFSEWNSKILMKRLIKGYSSV